MVRVIDNMEEFNTVLADAGDKLVVVDFTASWCGPCKTIGPKFEALSANPDNKNVVFLKVDINAAEEIANKYGVSSIPTFIFFRSGEKIFNFSGANYELLVDKLVALR